MLKKLTEDQQKEVQVVLSAQIYQVCVHVFEKLEAEQVIAGNGHHMAQKAAEQVIELLKSRWNK